MSKIQGLIQERDFRQDVIRLTTLQLANRYGCSCSTIKRAKSELRKQGYLAEWQRDDVAMKR